MKIVSFYADIDGKTYYSDCAAKLARQCEELGIEYDISERDFGSTWIDNVRAKPIFLLETLERLNESLIWLDCDCYVLKKPDFEVKGDWGVYMRDDGTPHDFVHYIENTDKVRQFLRDWIQVIEEQQRGSHTAFISIFDRLNSEVLPAGYFELGIAEIDSKQAYFETH